MSLEERVSQLEKLVHHIGAHVFGPECEDPNCPYNLPDEDELDRLDSEEDWKDTSLPNLKSEKREVGAEI